MPKPGRVAKTKVLKPLESGFTNLDSLSVNTTPTLDDYIGAVSEYVLNQKSMTGSVAKKSQIALSAALGRALRDELKVRVPHMNPIAGEVRVAGALRTARADVSESHNLDGLRLAVEIKPVNVAVGRAIWNRFGDIRAFAVNIHLKFPFAVVGGILAIPTFEWKEGKSDSTTLSEALLRSEVEEIGPIAEEAEEVARLAAAAERGRTLEKVSTVALIERAVQRFRRARLREIEADPPHLLEAVALIVYDPDSATLVADLPPHGDGMRWEEFVLRLVEMYDLRFEP